MSYFTFVNEEVQKEVQESPELYLTWMLSYGKYDDEIDPLHNPDWVKSQKILEVNKLENLKNRIQRIKDEYKTLPHR